MSGERDFLSRWSARKGEARKAAEAPEPAPEPAPLGQPDPEPAFTPEELETLSDAELCDRLSLPDPQTMAMGDDFKVFLEDHVPERLRRVALRRLWRSNPTLACLDGLNDYDEDYTRIGAPGGVVKTLYKVGMGFAKPEPDADAAEAAYGAPGAEGDLQDQENGATRDICAPECDSDASEGAPLQSGDATPRAESGSNLDETGCGGPSQVKSRRMAFRFVEKPNPGK